MCVIHDPLCVLAQRVEGMVQYTNPFILAVHIIIIKRFTRTMFKFCSFLWGWQGQLKTNSTGSSLRRDHLYEWTD